MHFTPLAAFFLSYLKAVVLLFVDALIVFSYLVEKERAGCFIFYCRFAFKRMLVFTLQSALRLCYLNSRTVEHAT